jgi:sulfur-carrier protein
MTSALVRVELPFHLRNLAQVNCEVRLSVSAPVTLGSVLDALEAQYPVLRGTIRDHDTRQRRAFLRFFACHEDLSHRPPDAALPEVVAAGKEPLLIIGAIAGGSGRPGRQTSRRSSREKHLRPGPGASGSAL